MWIEKLQVLDFVVEYQCGRGKKQLMHYQDYTQRRRNQTQKSNRPYFKPHYGGQTINAIHATRMGEL